MSEPGRDDDSGCYPAFSRRFDDLGHALARGRDDSDVRRLSKVVDARHASDATYFRVAGVHQLDAPQEASQR